MHGQGTPVETGESANRRKRGALALLAIESEALSKDLKRRGFSFVGRTVMYAYMQVAGLVNDHLIGCFRYDEIQREATSRS